MKGDPRPGALHARPPAASEERELLLALLLLLPPAVLLFPAPLNLLEFDPYPHLAAAGLASLALVPAGAWLLVRGARPVAGLALLLVLVGLGVLHLVFGVTDPFEARRALVLEAGWLVAFVGGARLGARGRERFCDGLVLLTLAALVPALGHALFEESLLPLAGVLGNSGPLSQAALPGAIVGGLRFVRGGAARRALGGAAFLAFVLHAAWTPVFAGAVVLAVALALSAAWRPWSRRERLALALLALAVVGATLGARALRSAPPEDAALAPAPTRAETTDVSGFGVRWLLWRRVPALLAERPWLGIGPGQFQAAFPPHRDPREIVVSRGGPCVEATNEVEHAHQDSLELLAELGVPGALVWCAFLTVLLLALARRLRLRSGVGGVGSDAGGAEDAVLCSAVLGVLGSTLFHVPLTWNAAAALPGFVLFGAVLRREGSGAASLAPARLARATAAAGSLAALFALPLVFHGLALRVYVQAIREIDHVVQRAEGSREHVELVEAAKEALRHALDAAPRSAPALLLEARRTREVDAWEAVLRRRPFCVEALDGLANCHVQEGELGLGDALHAWKRALALSADAPRLLMNLARVSFESGDLPGAQGYLARLEANGCTDREWKHGLASAMVLSGHVRAGLALLAAEDGRWLAPTPEDLYTASEQARADGDERRADAYECLAQLFWAREHAAAGDYSMALRSYRQALAPTRRYAAGGAPTLRMELAAAAFLAGRKDEANHALVGLGYLALDESRDELPRWADAALEEAGSYEPHGHEVY